MRTETCGLLLWLLTISTLVVFSNIYSHRRSLHVIDALTGKLGNKVIRRTIPKPWKTCLFPETHPKELVVRIGNRDLSLSLHEGKYAYTKITTPFRSGAMRDFSIRKRSIGNRIFGGFSFLKSVPITDPSLAGLVLVRGDTPAEVLTFFSNAGITKQLAALYTVHKPKGKFDI